VSTVGVTAGSPRLICRLYIPRPSMSTLYHSHGSVTLLQAAYRSYIAGSHASQTQVLHATLPASGPNPLLTAMYHRIVCLTDSCTRLTDHFDTLFLSCWSIFIRLVFGTDSRSSSSAFSPPLLTCSGRRRLAETPQWRLIYSNIA
jgi:hypothetical protein